MTPSIISERDLFLGWSCAAKVLHAEAGEPDEVCEESFELWMRSEVRAVSALAELLFADVTRLGSPLLPTLLAGKTVANVELCARGISAHAEYLELRDGELRLYGITAKVINPERCAQRREFETIYGSTRAEWRDCLRRLVVRAMLLQECLPSFRVRPFLIAPLDGTRCALGGLPGRIERVRQGRPAEEALRNEAKRLLAVVDVRRECLRLLPEVRERIREILAYRSAPTVPVRGYHCRECEFRSACWGAMAKIEPHVFDVGWVWFAQDGRGRPIVDAMVAAGKASALDIPRESVRGPHAARINLQIESYRSGREIICPDLAQEYADLGHPTTVRFLDLESLRSVLPPRADSGVNRLTLFSFSLHTLIPGRPLQHADWLHEDFGEDPNLAFIAALRAALGADDGGPILIWTEYELQCFKEIVSDCLLAGHDTPDIRWLLDLVHGRRLVDQHAWLHRHVAHPKARGKSSLKAMLIAVWSEDTPLKRSPAYAALSPDFDPYAMLREQGGIADGCAAMLAYVRMLTAAPAVRGAIAADIRRYNQIDTLAQVFLYEYWAWRLGL